MERQPLESRAVVSAGYDAGALVLELEFRSGRVYRYENVPGAVYEWLLRTKNKGGFVTRMIAGRYPERSLPDSTTHDGGARDGGARNRGSRGGLLEGATGHVGALASELQGGDEEDAALEQLLRASVALLSDALKLDLRPPEARLAEALLAEALLRPSASTKAER